MCVCVSVTVCMNVHIHTQEDTPRGQQRVSDPLELELQVLVSCLQGVLGTKLRSSEEQGMPLRH